MTKMSKRLIIVFSVILHLFLISIESVYAKSVSYDKNNISAQALTNGVSEVIEESRQLQFKKYILDNSGLIVAPGPSLNLALSCLKRRCLNDVENYLAAAYDLLEENNSQVAAQVFYKASQFISSQNSQSLADELQFFVLMRNAALDAKAELSQKDTAYILNLELKLKDLVVENLNKAQLTRKAVWTLLGEKWFQGEDWFFVQQALQVKYPYEYKIMHQSQKNSTGDDSGQGEAADQNINIVRELLRSPRHIGQYDEGYFKDAPMLFMFCRDNRIYPCLFVMKDAKNQFLRNGDGSIWSQPSLGLSGRRKPYNEVNGQTPQGVYRLDGVMPYANRPIDFGKFRRVILNFVNESNHESDLKLLLPESLHATSWWQESVVARDIGRNSLRIHGTGKRSQEGTAYYPLLPTSGCIAQRENVYDGIEYKDQRLTLDTLMRGYNLPVQFDSETQIRGVLYVVNINDDQSPVTLQEVLALAQNKK